ncbi:MAG: dihydropteroate synthase, partial [Roseovarius sp.]|uniref:dihydropteroate synthase n=1 Tax=Roseovarius sp. TaxID=1486281 RepID=UPI0040597744
MPYYRPIPRTDPARPAGALTLAGGLCWFDTVEVLDRAAPSYLMPAADLPTEAVQNLTTPRAPVASLDMAAPQIMGILNVTPDSFSDGGQHFDPEVALAHARKMAA